LNGTQTAINTGTLNFQQNWALDPTGNWGGFTEQASGGGLTLNQARASNPVNEITGITNSVGGTWTTPGYDSAGNMTTMPQPASPTSGYRATYDAWNRLMKLVDPSTGNTVQKNQYDGRNFRVARLSYTAGTLSETRQYFYTRSWQAIEERISGTTPDRQHVWGLRYIDDLVLRDRSVSGGTLNERSYSLQDANWNMAAICNTAAAVQERYAYSAYGVCLFLTSSFGSRSASSYDWNVLYTGRSLDSGTGLYDYRMRFYCPPLGVFIARDPIGYRDGLSLYCYVGCSPISNTDPSGTSVMLFVFCAPCDTLEKWSKEDCSSCSGDDGCKCQDTKWGKSFDQKAFDDAVKSLHLQARDVEIVAERADAGYSLTCPAVLGNKRKLFVFVTNANTCDALAMLAHEATHIRQYKGWLSGGPSPLLNQSRDKLEKDAYTNQCKAMADQKCLSGESRFAFIRDCKSTLIGLSTQPANVRQIGNACADKVPAPWIPV